MNHPQPCADDPQLTAYALEQLDGRERAAIEAALRADPALRIEVTEIRAAAAMLEAALADEAAAPQLADGLPPPAILPLADQDNGPNSAADPAAGPGVAAMYREAWGRRPASLRAKLFRFPRFYYVAGGLAAAGLAVLVALQRVEYDTREQARATMARIARARNAAEAPAGPTTSVVALPLSSLVADGAGQAGRNERARKSAGAGFRGRPAGVAPGAGAATRDNLFVRVADNPLSTFPLAVETAGYVQIRRTIRQGSRPPAAAVRIEEMLNYFPFRYPAPKGDALFAAALEVAAAPWYPAHRLVRIGLKGREAEETRVTRAGGPPAMLAKDVRIQVEFNPAKVVRYRLIGYDTRLGPAEDDPAAPTAEADEIAAGHTVTALYEILPVGAEDDSDDVAPAKESLRYRTQAEGSGRLRLAVAEAGRVAGSGELLTVTVWYRVPDESGGRWLEFPLTDNGAPFDTASPDFRFAAAVAQYGMILHGSNYKGAGTLGDVLAWAAAALPDPADDPGGYRFDFIDLVRRTQGLTE